MLQGTVLAHIHAKNLSAQAWKGIAQAMGRTKAFSHLDVSHGVACTSFDLLV